MFCPTQPLYRGSQYCLSFPNWFCLFSLGLFVLYFSMSYLSVAHLVHFPLFLSFSRARTRCVCVCACACSVCVCLPKCSALCVRTACLFDWVSCCLRAIKPTILLSFPCLCACLVWFYLVVSLLCLSPALLASPLSVKSPCLVRRPRRPKSCDQVRDRPARADTANGSCSHAPHLSCVLPSDDA